DADLRGMVVLRSLGFQLVPFKLHRFRKQRHLNLFKDQITVDKKDYATAFVTMAAVMARATTRRHSPGR
ncbi:hypothetical protein ACW5WG_17210, partial [Aeromonas salmonicida]